MKDLSIIIVNWNTKDFLKPCLESIFKTVKGVDYEIIVVDNASTDGSVEMLREVFPGITLIVNKKNAGFAAANNTVIKKCGSKYILLLNPDTLLAEDCVSPMAKALESFPKTAVVGCRNINPDGSHQVGDSGYAPSLKTVFNHYFFLAKLFPRYFRGQYISHNLEKEQGAIQVDHVTGACLMFRRDIIEKTGLMDESYFMYYEDTEWCLRIKKYGYDALYLSQVRIIHHRGKSSGKMDDYFSALSITNFLKYYKTGHSLLDLTLCRFVVAGGLMVRVAVYYLKYLSSGDIFYKKKAGLLFAYSKNAMGLGGK